MKVSPSAFAISRERKIRGGVSCHVNVKTIDIWMEEILINDIDLLHEHENMSQTMLHWTMFIAWAFDCVQTTMSRVLTVQVENIETIFEAGFHRFWFKVQLGLFMNYVE